MKGIFLALMVVLTSCATQPKEPKCPRLNTLASEEYRSTARDWELDRKNLYLRLWMAEMVKFCGPGWQDFPSKAESEWSIESATAL